MSTGQRVQSEEREKMLSHDDDDINCDVPELFSPPHSSSEIIPNYSTSSRNIKQKIGDGDLVIVAEQRQQDFTTSDLNKTNEEFDNHYNTSGMKEKLHQLKHSHHKQNDSIETTASQSIDLSSLLFNHCNVRQSHQKLEQQNQQQTNKSQDPQQEVALRGRNNISSSSLDSGSLSFAVSQVEFSSSDDAAAADDNATGEFQGVTGEGDDDDISSKHKKDDRISIKSSNSNSEITNSNDIYQDSVKFVMTSSHDPSTITNVGKHLFQESLFRDGGGGGGGGDEEDEEENAENESNSIIDNNSSSPSNSLIHGSSSKGDINYESASNQHVVPNGQIMMMTMMKFSVCFVLLGLLTKYNNLGKIVENSVITSSGDNGYDIFGDDIVEVDTYIEHVADVKVDDTDRAPEAITPLDFDTENESLDSRYGESISIYHYQEPTKHISGIDGDRCKDEDEDDGFITGDKMKPLALTGSSTFVVTSNYLFFIICIYGLLRGLQSVLSSLSRWYSSSSAERHKNRNHNNKKIEPKTPSISTREGRLFLTPLSTLENCMVEPMQYMSPCYGNNALDISHYDAMKSIELRKLLRERKADTQGCKQKLIRKLVTLQQAEFACLTVNQLRPKLRKRNLSQTGNKDEIIRRLVESGTTI